MTTHTYAYECNNPTCSKHQVGVTCMSHAGSSLVDRPRIVGSAICPTCAKPVTITAYSGRDGDWFVNVRIDNTDPDNPQDIHNRAPESHEEYFGKFDKMFNEKAGTCAAESHKSHQAWLDGLENMLRATRANGKYVFWQDWDDDCEM